MAVDKPRKDALAIESRSLAGYSELLVRAMYASAGAGAAAALRWADSREAMQSFEPSRLAGLSTGQMEMLVDDPAWAATTS